MSATATAPAPPPPNLPGLAELEAEAQRRGLLLRLQVGRPLGLAWSLRVGVARRQPQGLQLLGELKGWALPLERGLRLDTMRVQGDDTAGVGALIWAASFAWALEATPCRRAQLLAIRDQEAQHRPGSPAALGGGRPADGRLLRRGAPPQRPTPRNRAGSHPRAGLKPWTADLG